MDAAATILGVKVEPVLQVRADGNSRAGPRALTFELWLFLTRTPANKSKPELNRAAFQPPGDFAMRQFWEQKKRKKKPNKKQPNQPLESGMKWKCHGDSRSDSEGVGQGDCEWSPKPRGHPGDTLGTELRAFPGPGFPGERQERAPHTSIVLFSFLRKCGTKATKADIPAVPTGRDKNSVSTTLEHPLQMLSLHSN